jgi:Ser/Thr protein kinase RdoA (MazF antagonist)
MTDIPGLLHQFWGMHGADVQPLRGGMNSQTWLVQHQGSTYVAKRVPTTAVADLVAGGRVATRLAEAGFVTGPPVPTSDGRSVLSDHALALLEYVPGRQLDGDTDEEQRWIATTLADVHSACSPDIGPSMATFQAEWLSPRLPGVEAHPWLPPAIDAVRAETDPLTVTWSVLHTDPAPEAFMHDDSTGVTGLIDWAGARRGPVLYDVASAVMYLGGTGTATTFLDIYGRQGPLQGDEMRLLDAFRRFRWAVQATYFAWRLFAQDLTGGVEQTDNEQGLDDARRGLISLGLDVA